MKLFLESASRFIMDEASDDAGGNADTGDTSADTGADTGDTGEKTDTGSKGDDGAASKGDEDKTTKTDAIDWRKEMAGDDKKFLSKLQRYATEGDFGAAYRDLEKKVISQPKELGEDPTDKEKTAFRKSAGIPEKPEGYKESLTLPEGTVIGEQDQPLIDDFFKDAHENNWHPEQVDQAVKWYLATEESRAQVMNEQLGEIETKVNIELRDAWGVDEKMNKNIIDAFFARQPEVVQQQLGDSYKYNADFAKWLAGYIRENESSARILNDSEMSGVSVEDEIKKIQDFIRKDPDMYAKDKVMQERMGQLATLKKNARAA